jgi:acyl carrier protein
MNSSAANSKSMDTDERQILDDITQLIFAVSDNVPPSQKIDMDTLLIADLGLESIEIANLLFRLNAHYAGAVSIVDFVAASLRSSQAGSGIAPEPVADQAAQS